ncbi:MAG: adenylate/guanylate cyclase domain-containing protein [Solirubrobacteraceae bacterium]
MEQVQAGSFDVRVPIYDGTEVGRLQLGFNRMAAGLAERERIRATFGSYVDPDVAERILEDDVELDGEEVDVTIMFLDVRGFTAFAEHTEARDVVTALNGLFERVVAVIHRHGGRVDKFVGDGLLAVFGAPRRLENHADAGLAAATEIVGATAGAAAGSLDLGIGLNSGPVVAGNLGGRGRLEYGVIGDPVNVAARVQAHTRETGDVLLVTQDPRERLTAPPDALRRRDGVALRGRSEPIALYAL